MIKKNRALFLIIIGFAISVILSIYNIKNHDKNIFTEDGSYYHKMIKYDVYRYLSHGDEIKNQLKEGINFLKLEENIIQNIYRRGLWLRIIIFLT